ncbi:hypothetical protein [Celerinatantimonas diazotrophica]|uniref:Uncharacterized protein n=1 Tax=Celerinatantimonas diazotrophica TaxID=412034 RepID=A0A4R1K4G4_9GAMM|nr:hypothetical protein [Celerinatantimonas diazotrophica]TCK59026.1 hypothetical protein EV690_1190 [Celerinatantimonas diazotrophica]CAG9297661.1 hypothetical protein CEDIAZO_02850 [Celerinatantimonas diazotrophica]
MARHTSQLSQTASNVSSGIALSKSVQNSGFAKSLLSASFDQLIHGQFHFQAGDIVTLIVTSIVIYNFIVQRIKRNK